MDIKFVTKKLQKELSEEKSMLKAHGAIRSKKLQLLVTALKGAPSLSIFSPPMSPPHRCHELTGNRKGQISFDLDHPYRLIIKIDHSHPPLRIEGGLDWKAVTAIVIYKIEDTHG